MNRAKRNKINRYKIAKYKIKKQKVNKTKTTQWGNENNIKYENNTNLYEKLNDFVPNEGERRQGSSENEGGRKIFGKIYERENKDGINANFIQCFSLTRRRVSNESSPPGKNFSIRRSEEGRESRTES